MTDAAPPGGTSAPASGVGPAGSAPATGVGPAGSAPATGVGPAGSAPATGVGPAGSAPATGRRGDAGADPPGVRERLERAAWWGRPADALAVLEGLAPGSGTVRTCWLAGVCLGALGRYRDAARWLDPDRDSLAASCLASHLRQLGRHTEAEPLDELALATAPDPEARADALVGLVADAVGRRDRTAMTARLATARTALAGDPAWRTGVRLAWVTAEVALSCDDPATAMRAGRAAVRSSQDISACRHAVKSGLVLAASLHASGRARGAARVLRVAAAGAARLDLAPLEVSVRGFRAEILQVRAPSTARRERRCAESAQRMLQNPSESRITR